MEVFGPEEKLEVLRAVLVAIQVMQARVMCSRVGVNILKMLRATPCKERGGGTGRNAAELNISKQLLDQLKRKLDSYRNKHRTDNLQLLKCLDVAHKEGRQAAELAEVLALWVSSNQGHNKAVLQLATVNQFGQKIEKFADLFYVKVSAHNQLSALNLYQNYAVWDYNVVQNHFNVCITAQCPPYVNVIYQFWVQSARL